MLESRATLQSSGLLKVDEIDGSGDSLGPKVQGKRGGGHQRTSRLKKVTTLTLNHAILSMCTWIREQMQEYLAHQGYATTWEIYSPPKSSKNTRIGVENRV
ncbi:hypothetical protein VPH35_047037 [Triticum aestivum]